MLSLLLMLVLVFVGQAVPPAIFCQPHYTKATTFADFTNPAETGFPSM